MELEKTPDQAACQIADYERNLHGANESASSKIKQAPMTPQSFNKPLDCDENSTVSILISFSQLKKDSLAALTMILKLAEQHANFIEVTAPRSEEE